MAYNVNFSQDRAIDYYDPTSKSTYAVPSAYCDDLKGCGGDTHTRGQLSFNINTRDNCRPPVQTLQFSYSGFAARASGNNFSLFTGNAAIEGTTYVANLSSLVLQLSSILYDKMNGNPVAPIDLLVLLGSNATDPKVRQRRVGSNIIVEDIAARSILATLQRPLVQERRDQCQLLLGYVASTSLSLYGYNQATCEATTLWQASVSLFANQLVYTGATRETAGNHALNDLGVVAITSAAGSNDACVELQSAVEQAWFTAVYNKPLTFTIP